MATDTRGGRSTASAPERGPVPRPAGAARQPSADAARRPAAGAGAARDTSAGAARDVASGAGAARRAAEPQTRRAHAGTSITLTGRGGLVVVFALTLLGALAGGLFGLHSAQGLLFVAGCLLAAFTTRRTDLLTLVVSPPLLFFTVTLLSAVTGSAGDKSFLVSVILTMVTALTSNVPWLFLGAVLVVLIALSRGLPANLRDLRARVAADNPFRGRTSLLGGKGNADDDPVRWDETPSRATGLGDTAGG